MSDCILTSKSATKTKQIASWLTKEITSMRLDCARVIALEGNLGAGKTTFVQGFAAALGIKEKIQSPTFVLMKIYVLPLTDCHSRESGNPDPLLFKKKTRIPACAGMTAGDGIKCSGAIKHLIHIDAYRIETLAEIEHLGFHDLLKDKDAVILIEWADRIKKLLPKDATWITFEHGGNSRERMIQVKIQDSKVKNTIHK